MKVPSIRAAPDRREAGEPRPATVAPTASAASPTGYFRRLWRADIPLSRVFWLDMIVIGTLVNLTAMGLAFLSVALGASTAAGIAIFLAPVPYSILLVVSVWQRAGMEPSGWSALARLGALAWLVVAFAV